MHRVALLLAALGCTIASAQAQDPSNDFDTSFVASCEASAQASLPANVEQSEKMKGIIHSSCRCFLAEMKKSFSGDELVDISRAQLTGAQLSPETQEKILKFTEKCTVDAVKGSGA
ncbi:MAG TPA: hypothetical protein VHL08_10390 [Dongiaceae bacterium]|jgi:hypothetical protein|nr:hypothetical protein [Dongiaceae bacterium]